MKLSAAVRKLKSREISARALTEGCLACACDPPGQGSRVYTELFADAALHAADSADARLSDPGREGGGARALDGVPISVKDLFDVADSVTRAASRARVEAPPAAADAPAVARLRSAGAIIIG